MVLYLCAALLPEETELITKLHNQYRLELALGHVKVKGFSIVSAQNHYALNYNFKLEQMAQEHANKCVFMRSSQEKRPNIGENICVYSTDIMYYRAEAVIKDCISTWWNKINFWNPKERVFTVKHYVDNVDQFTAMAWGAATAIGCGISKCDDYRVFFVCNYGPR
ncbi:unnamed protein product [Bursaphelenchus okinawaensis]|uniref:SCP domain-containing protein n=1 Tax=Bursaphelenchus okinawaensis TaxID=465554 RepID=A0A811L0P7_9BILA|nr:unnamed protein product [Bursaphelenchus okinawaensis]CAG9115304.1 unnamed protein product [Bursaphelenchus okinawaensis]